MEQAKQKIQIYVVEKEKNFSRLNSNIWEKIGKYFEIDVFSIDLEEVKNIADKKVHLIIYENTPTKEISYADIDEVQSHNKSLHTAIITENTDVKNLTEIYENHIDYVFHSNYDDKYFIAKLKTILKRKSSKYQHELFYEFKGIYVDRLLSEIKINNKIVDTTKKEYKLIKMLVKNHDIFLSKKEIFSTIWGYDDDTTRVLDQYLHRVKKIIKDAADMVVDRTLGIKII